VFADTRFPPPDRNAGGPLSQAVRRIWASVSPETGAEAVIVADQIRLTRGTSQITDAVLPVVAALIAFGCRHWVPLPAPLFWVGAVTLICGGIAVCGRRLDPLLCGDVDCVRRVARLRTAMTGGLLIAWCAMGLVMWVPGNPVNHMFLMFVLACSLAASTSMLAPHPASIATALLAHGGVLVLRPAFGADALDLTLAGLGLALCVLMAAQARVVYAMAKRARELEFERQDIIRDLAKAKRESDRDRARAAAAGRAKSEFLSHMNHELRTPMNAILGFSELIECKAFADDVEKYAEYGAIIHESGGHLLALINGMLDLAKIEGGRLTLKEEDVRLAPLIREIVEEEQAKPAAQALTLTVDIKPGLPPVVADTRAMHHILANLLSNAVKFTPAGGHIAVSAKLESDGRLSMTVADDGIGIAPEDQLRVFERFGRARHDVTISDDKGTGLGLAVVKGFAEAHDGDVMLESAPGAGTRVTVYLPSQRVLGPDANIRRAG
jgi:two-component system cell cycle sensor histidine kinase PleC